MATAKTTAKAATRRKPTAKRVAGPTASPMPKAVREAASSALMAFEGRLLDEPNDGFIGAATRELKGRRSGMVKAIRFELDGGSTGQL